LTQKTNNLLYLKLFTESRNLIKISVSLLLAYKIAVQHFERKIKLKKNIKNVMCMQPNHFSKETQRNMKTQNYVREVMSYGIHEYWSYNTDRRRSMCTSSFHFMAVLTQLILIIKPTRCTNFSNLFWE
jgi:hypothetical protein